MRTLICLLLWVVCAGASAQAPARAGALPASASSIPTLETVSVTGSLPGPGLWKVSRNGHVLWVLGVIPTLPGGMRWRSDEVAQAIAGSQEVIAQPGVQVKLDTSFLGKLFLLPSAFSARKNADGKSLHDVLPPALYTRWQVLKKRYLGDDSGIERWRPIFAAMELYKRALKKNGLRGSGEVQDTVATLAKQHGLRPVSSDTTLEVHEPREAIHAFEAEGPDGLACFARTLDSIEHDIPAMRARANAWSTGDVAALRALPDSHFRDVCKDAITGAGFARRLGISDLPARVASRWLSLARGAIATYQQSFAVLPMRELLEPDGYLAVLRAQGYTVQSPDELDAQAAPANATSGG